MFSPVCPVALVRLIKTSGGMSLKALCSKGFSDIPKCMLMIAPRRGSMRSLM